jgi:hypothetical protein
MVSKLNPEMNIQENLEEKHPFFKTITEVKSWLDDIVGLREYTIHDNLVVDVNERVTLDNMPITHLPVQFGVVHSKFICDMTGLQTLKGFPHEVFGDVSVCYNKLKTLKYSPKIIHGDYEIMNNHELESLASLHSQITGDLRCYNTGLKFNDIEKWDFTVAGNITMDYDKDKPYLDKYRNKDADYIAEVNFILFKKMWLAQKLSQKLENDLPEFAQEKAEENVIRKLKI